MADSRDRSERAGPEEARPRARFQRRRDGLLTALIAAAFVLVGCLLLYASLRGLYTGELRVRAAFRMSSDPVALWFRWTVGTVGAGCCLYCGAQMGRTLWRREWR